MAKLTVEFDARIDGLISAIGKINQSIEKLQTTAATQSALIAKGFDQQASAVEKSARRQAAAFDKMGASLKGATGSLKAFGIAAAGIAAGAGLGSLTRTAVEFQTQIAYISTLLDDKADPAIERFREGVLGIAATSTKSANDLARGLYQALSSGIPATLGAGGALDLLNQAQLAATAGAATTEDAVLALTRVFNTYGTDAGTAAQVSDKLFQVVKDGVIEFPDLAKGIGEVSGVAAKFGVDFDQLAAVIAQGSRVINKAEVFTQTRNLIVQLSAASPEASEKARRLGIQLGEAAVKSKGLAGVLAEIVEKTGGSKEAIRTILPEVSSFPLVFTLAAEGGSKFAEQLVRIQGAAGTTADAVKKMAATPEAAFTRLQNAIQNKVIEVMERLRGRMVGTAKDLTEFVNDLDADAIAEKIELVARAVTALVKSAADLLRILKSVNDLDGDGIVGAILRAQGIEVPGMQQVARAKTRGDGTGGASSATAPEDTSLLGGSDLRLDFAGAKRAEADLARKAKRAEELTRRRSEKAADPRDAVAAAAERQAEAEIAFQRESLALAEKTSRGKLEVALSEVREIERLTQERFEREADLIEKIGVARQIEFEKETRRKAEEIGTAGAMEAADRMIAERRRQIDEEVNRDIVKARRKLEDDVAKGAQEGLERQADAAREAEDRERARREGVARRTAAYASRLFRGDVGGALDLWLTEMGEEFAKKGNAWGAALVEGLKVGLEGLGKLRDFVLGAGNVDLSKFEGTSQELGGLRASRERTSAFVGRFGGGAAGEFAGAASGQLQQLDDFFAKLEAGADIFVRALVDRLPALIQGATRAGIALVTALVDQAPELIDAVISQLPYVFDSVAAALPSIVEKLIATVLPKIPELAAAAASSFIEAFFASDFFPRLIEGIARGVAGAVNPLSGGSVIGSVAKTGARVTAGVLTGGLSEFLDIWDVGGVVGGLRGRIESYAMGGIVDAQDAALTAFRDRATQRPGKLAVVHPGERVLTAATTAEMERRILAGIGGGGGGGPTQIVFRGGSRYDRLLQRVVGDAFVGAVRQDGSTARTPREVADGPDSVPAWPGLAPLVNRSA